MSLLDAPGGTERAFTIATTSNLYPAPATAVHTIPGGYPVTPGTTMFLAATNVAGSSVAGCVSSSNYYADGQTVLVSTFFDEDMAFQVVFDDAPEPVPTLSEWAMILFGTILAGGAAVCIQRRRLLV